MIGKAIRSGNFGKTVRYVTGKNDANILFKQNLCASDEADRIAGSMRACARQSRRVKNPVYHLIVSWDPGDEVNSKQMETVARRLITKLRLEEHQVLVAEHQDCHHPHMHLVANRVHPEHGQVRDDGTKNTVWKGWKDGEIIQQELREMEVDYGWRQVEGSLSIKPGHELPPLAGEVKKEYHDRKSNGQEPLQNGRDSRHSETVARRGGAEMPDDLPRTRRAFYGMWGAASRGDAVAQWKMGRMYQLGAGVRMDMEIAAGWYYQAAKQGHTQAKRAYEKWSRAGGTRVIPPSGPMVFSRKEEGYTGKWRRRGRSSNWITDRIEDRIDDRR